MQKQVDNSKEPILFYSGGFNCFSNFSSFALEWEGEVWMTVEHAYQASKFTDPVIRKKIKDARSAVEAKELAFSFKEKQREDWSLINLELMKKLIRAKVSQHDYVKKKLLESGDRVLIESSPKDSFWGWGEDKKGQNHLGKIFMELREELNKTI